MIDDSILDEVEELFPPLTFKQLLENSRRITMTPYGLQDGNGVDVTLIYEALKLTPEQRVEQAYAYTRGMIKDRTNGHTT